MSTRAKKRSKMSDISSKSMVQSWLLWKMFALKQKELTAFWVLQNVSSTKLGTKIGKLKDQTAVHRHKTWNPCEIASLTPKNNTLKLNKNGTKQFRFWNQEDKSTKVQNLTTIQFQKSWKKESESFTRGKESQMKHRSLSYSPKLTEKPPKKSNKSH